MPPVRRKDARYASTIVIRAALGEQTDGRCKHQWSNGHHAAENENSAGRWRHQRAQAEAIQGNHQPGQQGADQRAPAGMKQAISR
jgi:hypothetical protein